MPDLGHAQYTDPERGHLDALGGGIVAIGLDGWIGRLAVAFSLALALVLDTADGRLARLQGTSSAFGRWLDQVLDELADMALHAAIAWAAFNRDGRPLWLLLGIIYASGKYLFVIQSLLGDELERSTNSAHRARRQRQAIGRSWIVVARGSTGWPGWFGWRATPIFGGISGSCSRSPAGSKSRWRLMLFTSRRGRLPGSCGRGFVMAEPRVSVLIVAKNEAHNLADCLAAASWAFERIVVVDPVSRDATLEIAQQAADVVAVRDFDDFASQRNFASGAAPREIGFCRSTPTSA